MNSLPPYICVRCGGDVERVVDGHCFDCWMYMGMREIGTDYLTGDYAFESCGLPSLKELRPEGSRVAVHEPIDWEAMDNHAGLAALREGEQT